MRFKKTIRLEDRARITGWLGDSHVWMMTALHLDRRSGRGQRRVETDSHYLNVAHVCTGLAIELALKALATSEGRPIATKHEATKNYHNLGKRSRAQLKRFVEEQENAPSTIDSLLEYLDETMCHPDRKYWMVGKRGEQRGTSFAENMPGLVIPDLAMVHAEIVNMAGTNTFIDWREGARPSTAQGDLIASIRLS